MWVVVESGLGKGRAAECTADGVTIGSGAGCALTLPDPDVAPLHAAVRRNGLGVELVPLDLYGELSVDGEPLTGTVRVAPGARIRVAGVELSVRRRAPSELEPDPGPRRRARFGRFARRR